MIKLFVRKIEELNVDEKQNIIASLSDRARVRLDKKRNEDLRLASLNALSLLTDEQRADLDYTESGRPFFKTLDADISISHSRTHAAVAVSTGKSEKVGIDIEETEPNNKFPSRFLTENERASVKKGTSCIEIWTKKEALFKYLKNDNIQFIHLDSTSPEIYGVKFFTIPVDDNIITVCADKNTKIEII